MIKVIINMSNQVITELQQLITMYYDTSYDTEEHFSFYKEFFKYNFFYKEKPSKFYLSLYDKKYISQLKLQEEQNNKRLEEAKKWRDLVINFLNKKSNYDITSYILSFIGKYAKSNKNCFHYCEGNTIFDKCCECLDTRSLDIVQLGYKDGIGMIPVERNKFYCQFCKNRPKN